MSRVNLYFFTIEERLVLVSSVSHILTSPPSEVCPFCGKTYKRLKSHLPHCKAAAASKAPPSKLDVSTNQKESSSQLNSVLCKAATKGKKLSSSVITGTGKKGTLSGPANVPSSSPLASSPLTSLPPSTKKKQKLVDQIKTTTLLSPPSPPLSPTISKPKKKSLRALIEAAKSDQVTKGSFSVTDPTLSSRNTARTKAKSNPGEDYALLSADTAPKDAPKKVSKTEKPIQMLSTTKQSESSTSSPPRDNFWEESKGETDLSMNTLVLNSGHGHQAKITLQDVKATLCRARLPRQSSRPSILSHIETTDNLCSKIRVATGVSPVPLSEDNQKYVAPLSGELLSTSPQHAELKSDKKIPSKTKQLALIPLQDVQEQTLPAASLLPAHVSSQVWQALPLSLNERLKGSNHMTGLLSKAAPVGPFSSFRSPLASQNVPVKVAVVEKPVRKQSPAENPTDGQYLERRSKNNWQIFDIFTGSILRIKVFK